MGHLHLHLTLTLPTSPTQPSLPLPLCIFCLLPYFQKFQARSSTLFGPALSLLAVYYCGQVCLYFSYSTTPLDPAQQPRLPCPALPSRPPPPTHDFLRGAGCRLQERWQQGICCARLANSYRFLHQSNRAG